MISLYSSAVSLAVDGELADGCAQLELVGEQGPAAEHAPRAQREHLIEIIMKQG